ncbi:MAG: hypothetical protein ACM3ZC_16765, partial [Bacteroidota bacterium]
MGRCFIAKTAAIVSIAVIIGLALANGAYAADQSLSEIINQMALPQEKGNQATKLTVQFFAQIQDSSNALLKALSSQGGDAKALSGKVSLIQREFELKQRQFQLDLAEIAGDANAARIVAFVQGAIPEILRNTSGVPSSGSSAHTGSQHGTSTPAAVANPNEVPLGSAPTDAGLDLRIGGRPNVSVTESMNGMGPMGGMQGNMPGMSGMNMGSVTATGGLDAAGRQMLTQLMANNASLIQMLSTLADGKNAANLQP